jgi:RHS repeat-associated protein
MADHRKYPGASDIPDSQGSNATVDVFRPEATFASSSPPTTSGAGLPSLSVPKGGGAVRSIGEKFAANPATGTSSLSVPIATSPGRGGFNLSLALSYDSGAGNGPFGLGWRLGVPSIVRKTDKGIPRYVDDSDVFILSGAEDLVPVQALSDDLPRGEYRVRRYRPRVEGGFARIERWTHKRTGESHWKTTGRDNVTSVFGRRATTRISDPRDPSLVFSWLLEETRDDRGNVVRYTYKEEDGHGVDRDTGSERNRFVNGEFAATAQRYLKRIEYGNYSPNDTTRWLFEVVFDYGEHADSAPTPEEIRAWPVRRDPFSTYRPGFEVRTYRLCRRTLMFHRFDELGPDPYLVRSTDFEYQHQGHLTKLKQVTQAGYLREERAGGYQRATVPPLDLSYVERKIHGEVRSLDPAALDGIPGGVDGAAARWVDLDGEGISGVLVARDRDWYYKSNLGGGRLSAPVLLPTLPTPAALGVQQLTDLGGAGRLDLVQYTPPGFAGFFERTAEGDWNPFTPFRDLPNIDWRDPNLRFLDVDGDGLADVLITKDEALVWYRSRGKAGFEPPLVIAKPKDETQGAAVIFADGTETIQLADMTGDGLVDIVRVRNGEVCYWPNLGYGRFDRKITLDQSPWLSEEDQFDPRRVRLADIDGSGNADLVYLGREGVRFYFNESGNRLSERIDLALPLPHSASSVGVVDLLGSGTACLYWSSALPGDGDQRIQYVDLMGGKKPHLLARFANGMGGETRLAYSSSTAFYLQDKAEGRPWITRLPFPVQVVERVERFDHVAGTRITQRYRYHHGFYDGVEREYRGFAYVEQWDAEAIGAERGSGLFPDAPEHLEDELKLPPIRTRTWFHTGAWLERERMETALAREFYEGDPQAPHLVQAPLPAGLSVAEEREAARALRGRILRQEIYAEDGLPESIHPYSVTEHSYQARLLHRAESHEHGEGHAHAIFFAHAREDLSMHYERRPDDPRIQHTLVLDIDDFGNVRRSAAIAYPRRKPAHPEQERLWCTLSDAEFVNRPSERDWYRIGVPITTATSELTGVPRERVLTFRAVLALVAEATEIPFEESPTGGLQRRVIAGQRLLYYRNDLEGPLPLGEIESRALLFETWNQAFTPGLVSRVYGQDVDETLLAKEARYRFHDGVWWAPSARAILDPSKFYQPVAAIDAFGERSSVRYDAMALLPVETEDALGNKATAGTRHAGVSTFDGNDYRVLAPTLLSDPNANRTAVAFDALGMPVRIALMGKVGAGEGDTLADPTTRIEYDLHRFATSRGAQPVSVHAFAREKHGAENPRWLESYSYLDGSAREVMRKAQAAPGEAPARGPDGRLLREPDGSIRMRYEQHRWVGSGRTVFDNKGNPVKKYEPFFSDTYEFESDRELVDWGVTPILRYDPLSRLIRTDLPDGTLRKAFFHSWAGETWDENDTVLESRWYKERGSPDPKGPQPMGDPRRRAAWLAAQHAETPVRAHLDSLGRTFLAEADNKDPRGLYRTRTERDVAGNVLTVIDARGNRVVDRQVFDLRGGPLFTTSADAGWSRVLPDVLGKAVRSWDARGHALRYSYDELRRATRVYLDGKDEKLVALHVYGEAHPESLARNLRTQLYQTYDGAGVATNARFDFKANLLEVSRRLATEYRDTVSWSSVAGAASLQALEQAAAALLERESFAATSSYDALNRLISSVTPDGSDTRPSYDEGNRIRRIDVAVGSSGDTTTFIESIDYNARGQTTRIVRGNQTVSTYEYEPTTFRLTRHETARKRGRPLQDLDYECDAVGNIVQIRDHVSFGNQAVSADGNYEYDPLYRLTRADGREHPGQQPSFADAPNLKLGHDHDLQALRRYREVYAHDPVGNLERVAHHPMTGAAPAWVRRYQYEAANNRLVRTSGPHDDPTTLSERYLHDAHGNMTAMPHLSEMRWDYADRLIAADRGGGGQVYFAYDAGRSRVRKVYEHGNLVEERIYVGVYEVYRKRRRQEEPEFERQTLHVMNGAARLALIETTTVDRDGAAAGAPFRARYQLENQVGSSTIETDESAQVISYEEYFPFGATSMRAGVQAELSPKRYRYAGKERDEETGLSYHGARYYAPWLGRWTASDPAGLRGGINAFAYVNGNPINRVDLSGNFEVSWTDIAIGVVATVAVAAVIVATAGAATPFIAAAVGVSEATVGTTLAVVGTTAGAYSTISNVGEIQTEIETGRNREGQPVSNAQINRQIGSTAAGAVLTFIGGRGLFSGGGGPGAGSAPEFVPEFAPEFVPAPAGGPPGFFGAGGFRPPVQTPAPVIDAPWVVPAWAPPISIAGAAAPPLANVLMMSGGGGNDDDSSGGGLPPAGGRNPPPGRAVVGGNRGVPGNPPVRPYPEDITITPPKPRTGDPGGDIPEYIQDLGPEHHGQYPEVYFERVPPMQDALDVDALQAAGRLITPGGTIRITTTPGTLADATRAVIANAGATIVSEGQVAVVTDQATSVGYEFVVRF